MNAQEIIKYKGFNINIYTDEDSMDPREDDNISKMICFHSRYDLGDKHNFGNPDDFREWAKGQGNKIEVLPLFLYDHSGITISTSGFGCSWDSGQIGWIYTDMEILNTTHGFKHWTKERRDNAIKWMESDVKTYDQYLTGKVFGYMIEGSEGDEFGGCWGFIGDDFKESGLLGHAKDEIQYEIKTIFPIKNIYTK